MTAFDGTNAGTWFLSQAVKKLPEQYEVVIAYSDPSADHHGGLYQAASWLYLGHRPTNSYHYVDKDGNRISKKTPWYNAKHQGLLPGERPVDGERRVALERGWELVVDLPKYKYAYARTKRSRRLLLAVSKPYPKPSQNCNGKRKLKLKT